jgi:cobalt-zinc-cadmium efflux system outer membrane protein
MPHTIRWVLPVELRVAIAPRRSLRGFVAASTLVALGLAGCISTDPDPKEVARIDAIAGERIGIPLDVDALLHAPPRPAEEPPASGLELEDAIRRALAHNLALAASSENVPIAQAELAKAGLLPNPTISLSVQWVHPHAPETDVTASILQELNGLLTRSVRLDIGTAQRFQVGIDLASQAFDLAQQVESKYRALAHLRRARMLSERIVEQYGIALAAAEARARVGVVPTPDVNRARLQWEDAQRQVLRLQAQYVRGARELNWLLGASSVPEWSIPDDAVQLPTELPAAPAAERAEAIGVAYRLDLLRARIDVRIGESAVSLARWGFVPDVQVGAAIERDETGAHKVGPLVSFTLPIFDPGFVAYELTIAQLRLADRNFAALEGQVRQDVRSSLGALDLDLQDVRFFRERLIPQQEENIRLAEESFRLGNSDLDSLLNTLREYVGSLQSYEDAAQAYFDDRVAFQRATGLVWSRFLEEDTKSKARSAS